LTIQITIVRIDGYGPWTVGLGSDREAALQMLQAKIYYDLQRLFSELNCLVYPNRFDEYFVISSGLSLQRHLEIQTELRKLYSGLKLSMAIGMGKTPFDANLRAYRARKQHLTLDKRRRIFGERGSSYHSLNQNAIKYNNNIVQIMHIDVNDSAELSSTLSPYEVTTLISRIGLLLSQRFLKSGAITFFIGGDNFMVVSNGTTKQDAKRIIQMVSQDTGIKLNCGIGVGRTGRKAAQAATKALDTIRDLRNTGKILPFYKVNCL
jgi:GTP cyclohydrolase IIa